jgi:protein SCO1/2
MRHARGIAILALVIAASACSRAPEPRRYEVRGQILGVDPARQEVLMKHEDIEGFMPAMTMPYKVQDQAMLQGTQPGDLVTATLVVEEVNAYLSTMTKTGSAPIDAAAGGPEITASDLLREGDVVPDRTFVDQAGRTRTIGMLRGHRVALTFIYTRCPLPDFCPLMDRQFKEVQQTISKTPELADVQLLSITLDPDFDKPAVLAQHVKTLGADTRNWHFVTGDRDEVLSFAKRFGIVTEPGDASAPVVHNLRTAVIDPEGRLVKAYSGSMWSPAELVADVKAAPAPKR